MTVSEELLKNADRYAASFDGGELPMPPARNQIQADVGIRPPFALEAFADVDADVRQSVARIHASPFLPHKDNVRGFVYEVEKGTLREVV